MKNVLDNQQALLVAYSEVSKSYHAIDEFRMKLLGFLPLASLVGVFLIDKDKLLAASAVPGSGGNELLGFAAIFAAMLTLALFGYEVRGIRRCHNLITEGKHLEEELGIGHGQFHVCEEEHQNAETFLQPLNAKLIACFVYSLVFAGWFFIALRFGFAQTASTCVMSATAIGVVIASISYALVRKLTAP